MSNEIFQLEYFLSKKGKNITNNSVIYKIINTVDDKIYIGSAIKFHDRIYRHVVDLKNNNHKNVLLQNAFNKYSIQPFKVQILETVCNNKQIIELEQKWLDHYYDCQKKCYNICKKAGNWSGNKHNIKTKKLISINNPNKKPIEQWSLEGVYIKEFPTMSAAAKEVGVEIANIFTACNKSNFRCKNYQWKYKNSNKKIIKYLDKNGGKKQVYQFSLKGKKIRSFSSIFEASKSTSINSSDICACCNGKIKSAGKFLWSYKKNVQPYKNTSIKAVYKIDPKTNKILKKYDSINQAAEEHNISANSISYVCKGKQKTSAKFKWKYAKQKTKERR